MGFKSQKVFLSLIYKQLYEFKSIVKGFKNSISMSIYKNLLLFLSKWV